MRHIRRQGVEGYNRREGVACNHRPEAEYNRRLGEGYILAARPGVVCSWSACHRRAEGYSLQRAVARSLPVPLQKAVAHSLPAPLQRVCSWSGYLPRMSLLGTSRMAGLPVVQVVAGKTLAGLLSSGFSY